MMGTDSKRSAKDMPKTTHNASSVISFSPSFLWQLLMRFAEYRMELLVNEVMVFPNGHAYYVCPRCGITLEREFVGKRQTWDRVDRYERIVVERIEAFHHY